jgi:acetyltransferase-like isoleucine patch superfamily enzyme
VGLRLRWLLGTLEQRALGGTRRAVFVWRARVQAWRVNSTVDISLAPDLIIGRRVQTMVKPLTHTKIRIAPRTVIGDGVTLLLYGGELHVGDDTQIRSSCILSVGGQLVLEGGAPISYGTVVHCGEAVRVGRFTAVAEYCTIADNTHFYTDPDTPFFHNNKFAPVDIGKSVFLAPRVSVDRGVTIGDFTIVGPNSTVAKSLPAGVFASGSPAKVVRGLDLPWLDGSPAEPGRAPGETNGDAPTRRTAVATDQQTD